MVGIKMKCLIDTCVFLELLLEQERARESEELLLKLSGTNTYLSEFTLYSMGIILFHQKQPQTFLKMIEDLLGDGGVSVIKLQKEDFSRLVQNAAKFNLDFDDAYQYSIAEKYNLTIISFDRDFDRTEKGRVTPEKILKELNS